MSSRDLLRREQDLHTVSFEGWSVYIERNYLSTLLSMQASSAANALRSFDLVSSIPQSFFREGEGENKSRINLSFAKISNEKGQVRFLLMGAPDHKDKQTFSLVLQGLSKRNFKSVKF